MPTKDKRPLSSRWIRVVWRAAPVVAFALWLGGCALMEDWPPEAAAGTNPPAVEPVPGLGPIAPGPIALAPTITGAPAPPPAPVPAPPVAALAPPPVPVTTVAIPAPPAVPAVSAAMPAPPPARSVPAGIPTFAPIACPPGAIAMWSAPDAAGTPVPLCRRFPPPR